MSNTNQNTAMMREIIGDSISNINTALPAVVVSYDSVTNKAVVKPVGVMKFPDNRSLPYPDIHEVPVIFPTSMGGACGVTFPIHSGDGCLLVFSQADISYFTKKGIDSGNSFQLTDAIAIPGLYNSPPKGMLHSDKLTLFFNSSFLTLSDAGIEGQLGGNTKITVGGGELTVNGISLTKHTHGGVEPGGSDTGLPK